MEDFELVLFDRLEIIKTVIGKYGEDKFYLSFSGGKDSTVLHYLLDMALPNNRIPRVFIDTGIEYNYIREFVYEMAKSDSRFEIIKPQSNIRLMLEESGYPFKSKEHSRYVSVYQNSGMGESVNDYLGLGKNKLIKCPKKLKYQFTDSFSLKISDKCCNNLKKKPVKDFMRKSGRVITLTGMKRDEKGFRATIKGCVLTDKKGDVVKFHPLLVVSNEWENWFIEREKIKLCKLYYPPFSFERTGCKGCPFSLKLQEQLDVMDKYLPNERKQCELIWAKVYAEYRRIGYRLRKE